VALTVFKTDEAEHLGLAGSIPVRLRQPTFVTSTTSVVVDVPKVERGRVRKIDA
jgi:hypothetical protein